MLRFFYRWLLRFHPLPFRKRFAEEMLSIFDHVKGRAAAAGLVADAFISLVRQWTMRSVYREENATISVPASADGSSMFCTLESFKPRKSALLEGAVLTWAVYSTLFLALRHSGVHYVYLPSVTFESVAGSDVEPPASAPNLPPTPGLVRPKPQSAIAIEPQTYSSRLERRSLRKSAPSESKSSLGVSRSQEEGRLDASGKFRRTITTPPLVQSLGRSVAPSELPKEAFFSYVGVYSTGAPKKLTVLITVQGGQPAIEIPGEKESMLVHVHGTRYAFSEAQDNWIEFMKQDDGVVYGLLVYRNGSEFTALRKAN